MPACSMELSCIHKNGGQSHVCATLVFEAPAFFLVHAVGGDGFQCPMSRSSEEDPESGVFPFAKAGTGPGTEQHQLASISTD